MRKLIFVISILFIYGCNNVSNLQYEANKTLAEKWVKTFEDGNIDLWKEVVSEDLLDIAPMYGMGQVDYATSLQVAEFYINNYTNVKFNNPVWLPGIDTATMSTDGSVRAYGTWTGESKSTGRTFRIPSYHNFGFKDGKIVTTGEYFDATGMVNAVGPVDRKVVVATLNIKKGNYGKVQEMMDSEEGLKTTRNYDGCTHIEAFFNEESGTYFIIEYWESFDKYQAYLDWRLKDDPSKLAERLTSLLVGGSNGLTPYTNNTGYNFY